MADLKDIMIQRLETFPVEIGKERLSVERTLKIFINIISQGYGSEPYKISYRLLDKVRETGIYKRSALLYAFDNKIEYSSKANIARIKALNNNKPAKVILKKVKKMEQGIYDKYKKLSFKDIKLNGKKSIKNILKMLQAGNVKVISKYGYLKRKYNRECRREARVIKKKDRTLNRLITVLKELEQMDSLYVYYDGKDKPRTLKISDILDVAFRLVQMIKENCVKPLTPFLITCSNFQMYSNNNSSHERFLINKRTSTSIWSLMQKYLNDNPNNASHYETVLYSANFRHKYLNAGRVELVTMGELFLIAQSIAPCPHLMNDLLDYNLTLPTTWDDDCNILVYDKDYTACFPLGQGNKSLSHRDVKNIRMLLIHYLLKTDKGIIKLLIYSHYSTYRIQKDSKVNHSIIARLRRGNHNIGNLNFDTVQALVKFYKSTDEYKRLSHTNIVV